MPVNLVEMLDNATSQMGDICEQYFSLLAIAAGIYTALLTWRLFKRCVDEPLKHIDAPDAEIEQAFEDYDAEQNEESRL